MFEKVPNPYPTESPKVDHEVFHLSELQMDSLCDILKLITFKL